VPGESGAGRRVGMLRREGCHSGRSDGCQVSAPGRKSLPACAIRADDRRRAGDEVFGINDGGNTAGQAQTSAKISYCDSKPILCRPAPGSSTREEAIVSRGWRLDGN
jgi:hypothetical protein